MKTFVKGLVILAVLGAAGYGAMRAYGKWGDGRETGPKYRYADVVRADIVRTVEATGTVTPRNSASGIPVGAQVNGKVIKLFADYNSVVTNGQVVALIDPLVYESTYRGAVAQLHVNEANVEIRRAAIATCEAELTLAQKTYDRKKALAEKAMAPVAELDAATESLARAKAGLDSAKASLQSAEASVEQSRATVTKAKADLDYCTIRSPVDGVVISRAVEEGQTVVSSMNAVPVLTIAEDLKTIWVSATVPESDVGNIKVGQVVTFTADAYRRKFSGKVLQVRKAATTVSNVVTYPIIIEAENPDEMLFPGMTATLSIETARAENVVAVPAAALRFRPKEEDREPGEVPRGRKVWIEGGEGRLGPVVITEGVADTQLVELVGGETLEGGKVVIGYQTAATLKPGAGDKTNPFKQKFPERNKNKGTAPEPKK